LVLQHLGWVCSIWSWCFYVFTEFWSWLLNSQFGEILLDCRC
jgi:hypothetical protein